MRKEAFVRGVKNEFVNVYFVQHSLGTFDANRLCSTKEYNTRENGKLRVVSMIKA
ncbi:hypothetical protein WH47_06089 [Habropoda laboriosa]|uniref:Uncharacterized protein n=1 Tax=Habropoda laboriosa TaxID=597456 RepID=A0A0L7QRK1_9HYME|nr:hypothetical protein WH47_06089 [Habropoda laboriosa]